MIEESGNGKRVEIETIDDEEVEVIQKYYTLGNAASTTYPMDASLTDWAYAASWDDFALSKCKPQTMPPLEKDFFTRTTTENIATAIFRIETYFNEDGDGE